MTNIITVLDLIKQMSVSVPSIIAGTMVLNDKCKNIDSYD